MSDTTTCPNCSATLPSGAAFCTTCGTKIAAPAPVADAAPPSVDDTRVDNPGLGDATQVYEPPAPVAAPPPPAPWQPADSGTPPPAPAAEPPAWAPPAEATPAPPAWSQPAAAAPVAAPPPQWGAPGAPGAPGTPGSPPVGGPPPAWNQAAPPTWGAPAPAPVTGTSSSSGGGSPIGGILALLGAVLALVGLFTPWIGSNIGDSTITGWKLAADDSGFDTKDPYLLLALALVAVVLGVLIFIGKARTPVRIVAVLVGLGIIVTHVRDWMDIADIAKSFPSSVEITAQYGFYLGFVGAGLIIIGAFMPGKKPAA